MTVFFRRNQNRERHRARYAYCYNSAIQAITRSHRREGESHALPAGQEKNNRKPRLSDRDRQEHLLWGQKLGQRLLTVHILLSPVFLITIVPLSPVDGLVMTYETS